MAFSWLPVTLDIDNRATNRSPDEGDLRLDKNQKKDGFGYGAHACKGDTPAPPHVTS